MATCLIHIPHLSPLFSTFPSLSPVTSFFTARVTPHENVTAAILSYAASHLHEGTGKLRKTRADSVCHLTETVPSLTVSEKWPPVQRFDVQAADRRLWCQNEGQIPQRDFFLCALNIYGIPHSLAVWHHRPGVVHPSIDAAKSCLTWGIGCLSLGRHVW